MVIPKVPILFIKPMTVVADPYPGKIIIPKVAQDGTSDYEGELTLLLGKLAKISTNKMHMIAFSDIHQVMT